MYNCFTSLLHREKTNKSLQCDSYKELPLCFLSITNDHKDPCFHTYITIVEIVAYVEISKLCTEYLYLYLCKPSSKVKC